MSTVVLRAQEMEYSSSDSDCLVMDESDRSSMPLSSTHLGNMTNSGHVDTSITDAHPLAAHAMQSTEPIEGEQDGEEGRVEDVGDVHAPGVEHASTSAGDTHPIWSFFTCLEDHKSAQCGYCPHFLHISPLFIHLHSTSLLHPLRYMSPSIYCPSVCFAVIRRSDGAHSNNGSLAAHLKIKHPHLFPRYLAAKAIPQRQKTKYALFEAFIHFLHTP